MDYKEDTRDMIAFAKNGWVDVVVNPTNCQNNMEGFSSEMAEAFKCDTFDKEERRWRKDMNKLGTIDFRVVGPSEELGVRRCLTAINAYTNYDGEVDYQALRLCLKKINHTFKGKHVALPIFDGDFSLVKSIIQDEMIECDVTVITHEKELETTE